MGFAGQRGQRRRGFGEAGTDEGLCGAGLTARIGVAGVGSGDGVAEVPQTTQVKVVCRIQWVLTC